ncbi:hypothetical protein [Domibacillus tundrae]
MDRSYPPSGSRTAKSIRTVAESSEQLMGLSAELKEVVDQFKWA